MEVLDFDYDIDVKNMIPFTEDQATNDWQLRNTTFFSLDGKKFKEIPMVNLGNGINPGECGAKQIFQMKDGKFILEVEDEEGVEYFFSENLQDLL